MYTEFRKSAVSDAKAGVRYVSSNPTPNAKLFSNATFLDMELSACSDFIPMVWKRNSVPRFIKISKKILWPIITRDNFMALRNFGLSCDILVEMIRTSIPNWKPFLLSSKLLMTSEYYHPKTMNEKVSLSPSSVQIKILFFRSRPWLLKICLLFRFMHCVNLLYPPLNGVCLNRTSSSLIFPFYALRDLI